MILPVELQKAIENPRWKSFFREVALMQKKSHTSMGEEENVVQEESSLCSVGSKRMYECLRSKFVHK